MRILIVSNFYPPRAVGGAEIVAHRQALELVHRGHDVEIFAGRVPKSTETGGEMDCETVDGLNVHLLSLRSLDPSKSLFWDCAARRLRAIMIHFNPEIVHFHNLQGLGANLVLEAKNFGAKTICTVHDHWGFCLRNTILLENGSVCKDFEACYSCLNHICDEEGKNIPTRLRRDFGVYCLSQLDALVFPTNYLKNAYREGGVENKNMIVQSNGIQIDRFTKSNNTEKRLEIVFIGYLGEHKGVRLLMQAIDRLLRDRTIVRSWHLNIVGEGYLRGDVERFVEAPHVSGSVTFLEKLPSNEITKLLERCDVLVLPSLWPENEPVVLLEAMAAGVAQLASRTGGHEELVIDGKSGFLFEPGSVNELFIKLKNYILDPEAARMQGDFNFSRRGDYSQSRTIDFYEQLYADLLPKRSECQSSDAIVICDGGWPSLEITNLFNTFSLHETKVKIRFLYGLWADESAWNRAVAVFYWDGVPSEALLLRARNLDIPIIGTANNPSIVFLSFEFGNAYCCVDYVEAIASILEAAETKWKFRKIPTLEELGDLVVAGVSNTAFLQKSQKPDV